VSAQGYGEGSYGKEDFESATQTHYPEKWIERLCSILEIPNNHQIVRFFTAWGRAEGGAAMWNPLNTTNHVQSKAHGSWQTNDYNTTTVANFNHAWQGVLATADTLEQDVFHSLVVALRQAKASGTTAEQLVNANQSAIKTWGTNPQTMLDVLKSVT
jgi:hypothetical protein